MQDILQRSMPELLCALSPDPDAEPHRPGKLTGMDSAGVKAFFERVSTEWEMRSSFYNEEVIDVRDDRAEVERSAAVIDVGTGTGFVAAGLAPRAASMVGLDSSTAIRHPVGNPAADGRVEGHPRQQRAASAGTVFRPRNGLTAVYRVGPVRGTSRERTSSRASPNASRRRSGRTRWSRPNATPSGFTVSGRARRRRVALLHGLAVFHQ